MFKKLIIFFIILNIRCYLFEFCLNGITVFVLVLGEKLENNEKRVDPESFSEVTTPVLFYFY